MSGCTCYTDHLIFWAYCAENLLARVKKMRRMSFKSLELQACLHRPKHVDQSDVNTWGSQ